MMTEITTNLGNFYIKLYITNSNLIFKNKNKKLGRIYNNFYVWKYIYNSNKNFIIMSFKIYKFIIAKNDIISFQQFENIKFDMKNYLK